MTTKSNETFNSKERPVVLKKANTLHTFQEHNINALLRHLKGNSSAALVSPTASGKTTP